MMVSLAIVRRVDLSADSQMVAEVSQRPKREGWLAKGNSKQPEQGT